MLGWQASRETLGILASTPSLMSCSVLSSASSTDLPFEETDDPEIGAFEVYFSSERESVSFDFSFQISEENAQTPSITKSAGPRTDITAEKTRRTTNLRRFEKSTTLHFPSVMI